MPSAHRRIRDCPRLYQVRSLNDIVDAKTRSRMMSAIRSKDTGPELTVRRELFRRGFRYRIHYAKLPGRPDIVLPKYRAVIMVNGCFWHGHGCRLSKLPATRTEFWKHKIDGNRARDRARVRNYLDLGWKVMLVWECAIRGRGPDAVKQLGEKLEHWLITSCYVAEIDGGAADS